ncbi:hypothetical protein FRC05_006401 [Tulasnella sp. 425]|nr:hypothetical protein FRC05_006401 [Tulasnella sp. 425]
MGYKTISASFPSVGASAPLNDFQPDVAVVRTAIVSSVDAGSEVVLFVHGYGGFPSRVPSINPEQGPSQYEVAEDGMEIMTFFPITTFYNGLLRDAAEQHVAGLKRQSYQVFASKLTYAAYRQVLTTSFYAEKDFALPIQYQRMIVEGSGVNIATEIFDSDHSVVLAIPEKISDSIRGAVGESGKSEM